MIPILAVDVDLVTLGSMIVTVLTVAGTALTTGWIGVKKLCVYMWGYGEPKISKAIEEHTGLVADMRANIPVVGNTMKSLADSQAKLVETQQQQCITLRQLSDASSRHEELHSKTAAKLDRIIGRLDDACPPRVEETEATADRM